MNLDIQAIFPPHLPFRTVEKVVMSKKGSTSCKYKMGIRSGQLTAWPLILTSWGLDTSMILYIPRRTLAWKEIYRVNSLQNRGHWRKVRGSSLKGRTLCLPGIALSIASLKNTSRLADYLLGWPETPQETHNISKNGLFFIGILFLVILFLTFLLLLTSVNFLYRTIGYFCGLCCILQCPKVYPIYMS